MAISSVPWSSVTAADYTEAQWARACLIDTRASGDPVTKGAYTLPVRMPNGDVNRNALGAAAAALAGARGGVQASREAKKSAARKLIRLYHEAQMEPPDSLRRMAG